MKRIEINLNKLYSHNKPDLTNMGEYENKIREQLINEELKSLDIILIGTSPIWLTIRIVLFLENYVNSISIKKEKEIVICNKQNKFFI